MLHFSRLKAGVILCVCLIGILLSIPSFTPAGRLPAWYPQSHVNLGLDLQGGSYLRIPVITRTHTEMMARSVPR
jgi:preprotein translocase subunit SecD